MTQPREDWLERPHSDRFDLRQPGAEACMTAHRAAVDRGDAGYIDPTSGLFVMTATHLAERDCCERGCRHCPWVI